MEAAFFFPPSFPGTSSRRSDTVYLYYVVLQFSQNLVYSSGMFTHDPVEKVGVSSFVSAVLHSIIFWEALYASLISSHWLHIVQLSQLKLNLDKKNKHRTDEWHRVDRTYSFIFTAIWPILYRNKPSKERGSLGSFPYKIRRIGVKINELLVALCPVYSVSLLPLAVIFAVID